MDDVDVRETSEMAANNRRAAPVLPYAWKPGQSGNPAGRPKSFRQFAERCRVLIDERQVVERMAEIAVGNRSDVAVAAARLLFEYAWGKPSQKVDVDVAVKGVVIHLPARSGPLPIERQGMASLADTLEGELMPTDASS